MLNKLVLFGGRSRFVRRLMLLLLDRGGGNVVACGAVWAGSLGLCASKDPAAVVDVPSDLLLEAVDL